jgi:hypothetical protein
MLAQIYWIEGLRLGIAPRLRGRRSVGRSSLLAACVMSRNGFTVGEALARIAGARGCEAPETAEQRARIEQFGAS